MSSPDSHKTVRHALGWSMGGAVAMSLLMTAITAVTARLLTPAAFGEFAVVAIIQTFALFFGQRGLTTAIIQHPGLTREDMGAAFVASAAIGVALAAVIALGAPLWVMPFTAFDQARLEHLIAITALAVLFACAASPAAGMLQRRMDFRAMTLFQLAGVAAGNGLVAIGLARAGFNAAALAWGSVAGQLVSFVLLTWRCRRDFRFRHIRERIRGIAGAGFGFSLLRVFDLARSQLQYAFVAMLHGSTAVGLYQRSSYLLDMALQFTVARATSVLFPMLCRADEAARLKEQTVARFVGLYALFVFPICAGIAAAAAPIIAVILGPEWIAAVPILHILTIAAAAYYMAHPLGGLLEARKHIRDRLVIVAVELGLFSVLVWSSGWGTSAVLIASAAAWSSWCSILLYILFVTLRYGASASATLLSMAPGMLIGGGIYAANSALLSSVAMAPAIALLSSVLLDGAILAAGAAAVFFALRGDIHDDLFLGQVWRSFQRSA